MFVAFWLFFLASGLVLAAGTVAWGIRSRQFEEQDRARYLPLSDLSAEDYARPIAAGARTSARLVTGTLLVAGGLAAAATLATMTGSP